MDGHNTIDRGDRADIIEGMNPRPTDIRVLEVESSTQTIPYRTPMKFGGRVVDSVTLLDVQVTVENRSGARATGGGSMPMGVTWGWPRGETSGETKLLAMLAIGRGALTCLYDDFAGDWIDPLEASVRLSHSHAEIVEGVVASLALAETPPRLAQLVAASPVEAAIFDAFGKAAGQSAYRMLGPEFIERDLATYLRLNAGAAPYAAALTEMLSTVSFADEWLDQYVLQAPRSRMPLYHLVGALDPLTPAEQTEPVSDGLPETLAEWIDREGLTHLKIKLAGNDLEWDVARVLAVSAVADEAAGRRGHDGFQFSLDFNEQCENVDYLLTFLRHVKERGPRAYDRTQYIEQPTHRDLAAHPENRVHAAAVLKPVVIDESLVDFESFLLAREQGYSGVALKACKGHAEALLMAAAAQKFGMFLAVQDLTCPGASFLHSASLAAWLPGIAGIEGNGRQYCPAGNAGWDEQYPGMFTIVNGRVGTGALSGPGLGHVEPQAAGDGLV